MTYSPSDTDPSPVTTEPIAHNDPTYKKSQLLEEPKELVVFDTETTGLDHKSESLIEVAAVELIDGEIGNTFTSLVKPTSPIRHSSYKIHHISEDMVEDAPSIEDVLPKLLAFMGNRPFIAHNAIFDYSFVNEAHKRLYNERWQTQKIDSLEMFRQVFPDEPSHGLHALLARFGIEAEVTHRALDDAMCLARVYPKLRSLYKQRIQWQLSQMGSLDYLLERYLRLQKSVQIMQSEMSDLKSIFKLYFQEGGRSFQASTGDTVISTTRRSYEYNQDAVWPVLLEAGLVKRACRLNTRQLDKIIGDDNVDESVRQHIKAAREGMSEFRSVNFLKPQPPAASEEEESSAEDSTD